MAGKNTAVFGIYRTRADAENGVDQLITSGFRSEDISVLLQDNLGTKDFVHEKHTKVPEGMEPVQLQAQPSATLGPLEESGRRRFQA